MPKIARMLTSLLLALLLLAAACTPPAVEPPAEQPLSTPADPLATTPGAAPVPSPFPHPTGVAPLMPPPAPAQVPDSLPLFVTLRDPIPLAADTALRWAETHGWSNLQLQNEDAEKVRLSGAPDTAGNIAELTFVNNAYEQAIIFSSTPRLGLMNGPTPVPSPTPPAAANPVLPPEQVTAAALAFVRAHELLPEPIIARELPYQNGAYRARVTFAPAGFPIAGIVETAGVEVWMTANGRVTQARILPGSYAPAEMVPITPHVDAYAAFIQGGLPYSFFYERVQLGENGPTDPLRYQAFARSVGELGDYLQLVYAPEIGDPAALRPYWLVTRAKESGWNHFDEFYLPAAAAAETPQPAPSPTPLAQTDLQPQSVVIIPPLLVDGEDGRLYANAAVDGITRTVALDAVSGDLLAVFGLTGGLALDSDRHQLYVDKYPYGLTVIDTTSGAVLNEIELPPGERGAAQPHADPATGNVLLFRDQMLLIADPLSASWQQTIPFTVAGTVCGEPMVDPPAISQTWFDPQARLLYLSFVDYVCTPWVKYTIIVYDLHSMSELARYPQLSVVTGAAVNGRFYAKSWSRPGMTHQWGWQNGEPWLPEQDRGNDAVAGFSGFQVDVSRGRLYEISADGLQALDMQTMTVLSTAPAPAGARLTGFDPVTNQLYFIQEANGTLQPTAVSELFTDAD